MKPQLNAEIRFGAVAKPIRVPVGIATSVTETKEISFRKVHDCGTPVTAPAKVGEEVKAPKTNGKSATAVKQQEFCPSCNVLVETTTNGFEYAKGEFVTFTDEEVAQAKGGRDSLLTIEKFVPRNTISPLVMDTHHYLIPNATVQNGYATLYQALAKTKAAGFGTHSLWGKQKPFVIYAETGFTKGVLMLMSLHLWEDMVPPDFASPIPVKEEAALAQTIITKGMGTLLPSDLKSAQRARVEAMVNAKTKGIALPPLKTDDGVEPEEGGDLLEALQKTLAAMNA